MHIVILALGTRGDVQPHVALGRGLQAAGHDVVLLALDDFAALITGAGLGFLSAGIQMADLSLSHYQAASEAGGDPLGGLLALLRSMWPLSEQVMARLHAACTQADVLVGTLLGMIIAREYVDAHPIPYVVSMVLPASRTRAFPTPVLPVKLPAGSPLNVLTHRGSELLGSVGLGWAANRYRRTVLEFPARSPLDYPHREAHGRPIPWLFAHSPVVIPPPDDWPPTHHTTGYWFLESPPDWQPPADLAAFLAAGPPPVYVGFGSMAGRDPAALTRLVVAALARAGQRGVLLTGWAGVTSTAMPDNIEAANLPDTVFPLAGCPHDWLFPKMAAVVHHGGAGTTAAGLRAGVPSILVPFMGDQPFWAGRVEALGVGPRPIPRGQLTADRLSYAIRVAVAHEGIRTRAAALGERLRAEDGVGEAVRIIQAEIARFPAPNRQAS